jgi:Fe-S-cluster-containing dehydrogenase component/anaerobic selenocysteine-containing dehydrogenase
MDTKKIYWKGNEAEQISSLSEFSQELPQDVFETKMSLEDSQTSRRDFLKYLGFGVSAAALASCEAPVVKSIPYLNKPEDITPGVANWYASTYFDGYDYASILVKTREGRPIHIQPNKQFGLGVLNARINASVLSLYDGERLQNPIVAGKAATWETLDAEVKTALTAIKAKGKKIVLLTPTLASPSSQTVVDTFVQAYGAEHVMMDSVSRSAMRKANEQCFGKAILPSYHFDKAKTIVSFSADFLNDWLINTANTQQYAKGRNPENEWMSAHFQFEANLSVTGSNADYRIPLKPSEEYLAILALYNIIAKAKGANVLAGAEIASMESKVQTAAQSLLANAGESLVVCGHNHVYLQVIVNAINNLLGNYAHTIDLQNPIYINQMQEDNILALLENMKKSEVGAVLTWGVNPAYYLPNADEFMQLYKQVELTIALSLYQDETASQAKYIAPMHHYLESWSDYQVIHGQYALAQPTIGSLYNTRQAQSSLLTWADKDADYHAFIQENWISKQFKKQNSELNALTFWNNSLHNGSAILQESPVATSAFAGLDVQALAISIVAEYKAMQKQGYELCLYRKISLGDGSHVANPWLQELPDPMTKATWDNYITMNPKDMEKHSFVTYYDQEKPLSVAQIQIDGKTLELPVFPAYGQKQGTIGVALGYGRGANNEKIGKAAYQTQEYGGYMEDASGKRLPIGKNAYNFVARTNQSWTLHTAGVQVVPTEKTYLIASTQTHHTVMDRGSVLKETTFATYKNQDKSAYNPANTLQVWSEEKQAFDEINIAQADLWDAHPNIGHRWGLSIDLNTCIGCGACATACQSENNVPVVGKDEIRRVRDMFWLRIDRYFSSDYNGQKAEEDGKNGVMGAIEKYHLMEVPSHEDTLSVVFQPLMCQHCNHAPCETVCPVAATTHSSEGLNQMTYNRCVGTRYCANNCPYKVRRFNWFNYTGYKKFAEVNPSQDVQARMVLNPDVAVRTRGVMEKCSMCVQRIQAGKLEAKKAGTALQDGTIQTACSAACPTQAITFGDLNDKDAQIVKKAFGARAYRMLEEVGTQSNVYYLTKVRNKA